MHRVMCSIEAILGKMIPHTVKDNMLSTIFPADARSHAPPEGKGKARSREFSSIAATNLTLDKSKSSERPMLTGNAKDPTTKLAATDQQDGKIESRQNSASLSHSIPEKEQSTTKRKSNHDSGKTPTKKQRIHNSEVSIASEQSEATRLSKKEKKKHGKVRAQKPANSSLSASSTAPKSLSTSDNRNVEASCKAVAVPCEIVKGPPKHSIASGPMKGNGSERIEDPGRSQPKNQTPQSSDRDEYGSKSSTSVAKHQLLVESSRNRAQSAPASASGRRSTPGDDSPAHLPRSREILPHKPRDHPRVHEDTASGTKLGDPEMSFAAKVRPITFTPINAVNRSRETLPRSRITEHPRDTSASMSFKLPVPTGPRNTGSRACENHKDVAIRRDPYIAQRQNPDRLAASSGALHKAPNRQQQWTQDSTRKPIFPSQPTHRPKNETRRRDPDMVPVSCRCTELPKAFRDATDHLPEPQDIGLGYSAWYEFVEAIKYYGCKEHKELTELCQQVKMTSQQANRRSQSRRNLERAHAGLEDIRDYGYSRNVHRARRQYSRW